MVISLGMPMDDDDQLAVRSAEIRAERDRLAVLNAELVAALETIRDSFWTDGETGDERVASLQELAGVILAKEGR